ncbi:MAG TPA: class I SAM-dependent methyltransferase [Candidatus Babeliales bacterium]|nr:class I SAM-dependent methyltransferase [Candidatus Babeliales bacterium]
MNKPSLYLNLCTEFFDLDKPAAPAEEYAFYRYYVARSQGPILEPMCGTGRYLIPLVEEGFTVEGFDASPFMLKALHTKCAQKNITPHVWEQFLEGVPVTKQYNLIFIPDSSFCLFLNPAHIKMCLQKIYNLLENNGTFVFDIETIYAVPALTGVWQGKAYKKPDGTTLIASNLPLPIENSVATVICRYELMDKTNIMQTEMEYFQIKLYYPTEMDVLLKEVGFSHIKKIEAYNLTSSPSAQDYTIVYECIK